MIQEQQILEQVAGSATLYAMGQKGFTIAIDYVTGCYEWVINIQGADAKGDPFTIETRHANPETAWRRARMELASGLLFPI